MAHVQPMKLPLATLIATCCWVLPTGPAAAESCDERYPGSCRMEVSGTIVMAAGNQVAKTRRGRVGRAKPVRLAKVHRSSAKPPVPLSVPFPRPSPMSDIKTAAEETQMTARLVVDDAFNLLTANEQYGDPALERALLNQRNEMLGLASRSHSRAAE